jgi:hypothetical protein
MRPIDTVSTAVTAVVALAGALAAGLTAGQQRAPDAGAYPELPSETPATFAEVATSFDHQRREVMITMRDGVRLHTVILVPRGAAAAPILLTRTPYDANDLTRHAASPHLGPVLQGYDNAADVVVAGGYIRVIQDVRGKHGSEGDYVMNRPLRGPANPTPVDHATDTYDTIEWLVKNVPESNRRVGMLGISYNGFLALMALVDPHPALKVVVAMNPMVDGWVGDDWFHNGAFRQQNLPYIYGQQATRTSTVKWWTGYHDDYDTYLEAGSAGELGHRRGMEQLGFWRKILAHPTYDAFWRDQALDRQLAARPLAVPVMLVHSLWDAEDIYGAVAVYEALEPKDTRNDAVFLVAGPWGHGQMIGDGSSLGALRFGADTALEFRRDTLQPFLDQFLKECAPRADVAPATVFETGANAWRRLPSWPAGCAGGCVIKPTPIYLRSGLRLAFAPPQDGDERLTEYVSDPAKPVPYRARPIQPVGYDADRTWPQWLVDDQREASGRTDVLAFVTEPLEAPMRIAGRPVASLVASTTGTDADWVVKLVDVYPSEVAAQPAMGGYQLMVAAEIFRGRYRESFEKPTPIAPGKPLTYRFALPSVSHVFLPGHRVMVQVQSSWFPLYDRNPQTFVPSIFTAEASAFRKATHSIRHAPDAASFVELPLVVGP